MKAQNSRCLVLNGDYSLLGIINWKKALTWIVKYDTCSYKGVEVLDFYKDDFVLGPNNKKHPIPCVIRTKKYFRLNHKRVNFSRKNIFIRDNYTCQYCGICFNIAELTYDHIIPRSLWSSESSSPTSWTNIVTACYKCNSKKGNRTPQQANMPLLTKPVVPKKNIRYLPVTHQLLNIHESIPSEWRMYFPPELKDYAS